VNITNFATKASVTLTPGSAFDGQYAFANVAEGGSYVLARPGVRSIRLEYDGLTKPLLVRVTDSRTLTVKSGGIAVEKVGLTGLVPGSWTYDAETNQAVLWLAPGDAFDLTF
jgi:hypothetical protein